MQFEKKAQQYILDNIRASYSGKRGLISRIESFKEDTGKELTFANFISHYHMEAREIYGKFSFARLMDVSFAELPAVQLRMMLMFHITVWQKYMADFDNEEARQNMMDLADLPILLVKIFYMWMIVMEKSQEKL